MFNGMLLLLSLGLVFGQISGTLIFGSVVIVVLTALFVAIDFMVFRVGVKMFK